VSIEETVACRLCMQGSIEDVKDLRKAVASAIANCEGIGAKGELDELRDVSRTLEHGRSGPLRDTRGGLENDAWTFFQSGNKRDVRLEQEEAAAAAEIDRKAEQMALQKAEAEADRRRQEAADAKSRKKAAEAESRAADTERKKEEYRVKKAQQAAENKKKGIDPIHNPLTRGIAFVATAGQSEWYYTTRDVIKTGQAIAKGDAVGATKGIMGLSEE